ncbi:GNAT family N-acetyltransferase [Candidatus Gracilibacteria bacterium]|nr:GNAT family N-acetyltransferase [Candidatus Gracilibacteria bacterium]
MEIFSERLVLTCLGPESVELVADYVVRNWTYVAPFMPLADADFFTVAAQREKLRHEAELRQQDRAIRFYLFHHDDLARRWILGDINLSNIVRGAFQSCFLGYKMALAATGKGYMTEAVARAAHFAFHDLHLHRIEANIMPRNVPSRRVVEKLGFVEEGLARKYLKINGIWEDHLHYVLLNPDG